MPAIVLRLYIWRKDPKPTGSDIVSQCIAEFTFRPYTQHDNVLSL